MFKIKSIGARRLSWFGGFLVAVIAAVVAAYTAETEAAVLVFAVLAFWLSFAATFCLIRGGAWVVEGFRQDRVPDRVSSERDSLNNASHAGTSMVAPTDDCARREEDNRQ